MGMAMLTNAMSIPNNAVTTPLSADMNTSLVSRDEAQKESTSQNDKSAKTFSVEERVREYFKDVPIMIDVAYCESKFNQLNPDGTVFRGKINASDVGVMQVNEMYHSQTAGQKGLDLHTLEGNLAYARFLYETQGTAPWNYSSGCWDKKREVALNQ